MQAITSAQNTKFKLWKSLLESKGIKKESKSLISGSKVVPEIWNKSPAEIEAILVRSGHELPKDLSQVPSRLIFELPFELFAELDVAGTNFPILVKKLKPLPTWNHSSAPDGLELLLPFGDPQNLGAVIRTAVAFEAKRIILLEESASPYLPKVTRTSSGLNHQANLFRGPSIKQIEEIENVVALDMNGENIGDFVWPENCRLLIGDEGPGVPSSLENLHRVNIPISKEVESLNATTAAAIALFSYNQRIK